MALLSSLSTTFLPGGMGSFNNKDGLAEALVRGYKSGFLKDDEYGHLARCDTMEGNEISLS